MSTLTLDRLDDTARELAQDFLAGDLDGHAARSAMCTLLLRSRVLETVAWSTPGLVLQQRVDLAESLLSIVVGRVLDEDSSFELDRVATGSLCGWARNLGTQIARWDTSVRPKGMDAITTRVDPTAPDDRHVPRAFGSVGHATVGYHTAMAFSGLSTEDRVLSDWTDTELASEALERALNLTGFARGPVRGRAGAAALREVLGLPALCVPAGAGDRAEVLARVLADVTLARRSLVQMASMVCSEPPNLPAPGERSVGELMLSLWDDYDPEHLESLMVRPAKAAHMIVEDALTLQPKPARATVRAVTREVRAASTSRDWAMVQEGLVASYLATCTQAVSQFDDTNDPDAKVRKQALADEQATRFPTLASRVAGFSGAPLGSTSTQVAERLAGMLGAAHARETDERIACRHRRGLAPLGLENFEEQAA